MEMGTGRQFPRIAYQSNGLSRDDAVAHLFQQ